MRDRVAHSTRGHLRVRYPIPWLKARRAPIESCLRAISGVRGMVGRTLTGSVRIDYDPFHLAEKALMDEIPAMTSSIAGGAAPRGRATEPRVAEIIRCKTLRDIRYFTRAGTSRSS